jgi:hypothetical protein
MQRPKEVVEVDIYQAASSRLRETTALFFFPGGASTKEKKFGRPIATALLHGIPKTVPSLGPLSEGGLWPKCNALS